MGSDWVLAVLGDGTDGIRHALSLPALYCAGDRVGRTQVGPFTSWRPHGGETREYSRPSMIRRDLEVQGAAICSLYVSA